MKIIYVAGAMTPKGNRKETGNAAIEYLLNVRAMIQASIAVLAKGWAPYCPGLDCLYFLGLPDGGMITEEEIKNVSMAFLEMADAIVMLPGWENSAGSQAEYRRAVELEMPIFEGVEGVPDVRE